MKKQSNLGVVERKDSHIATNAEETKVYTNEIKRMCGNAQVPAVQYKGKLIPARNLGERSYLTAG